MHYVNLDYNDRKKDNPYGRKCSATASWYAIFSALNKQYILENFGFEAKEFELTDVVRQKG